MLAWPREWRFAIDQAKGAVSVLWPTVAASLLLTLCLPGPGAKAAAADCNEFDVDCRGQREALRLAVYGMDPIRAWKGPDVVRVIYSDDYGRPMPAIVLVRRPAEMADLTVIFPMNPPAWDGKLTTTEFRRVVRTATVSRVEAERIFARAGALSVPPEQGPGPKDPQAICIHPRHARIEAVIKGRLTVRERDTCDEDDLFNFALDVGDLAIAHRPECAALEADLTGWTMYRLEACGGLTGNLRAAASALNAANRLLGPYWIGADLDRLTSRFEPNGELRWGGIQPAVGPEAAKRLLASLTSGGNYGGTDFQVEGVSETSARIKGRMFYWRVEADGRPYERGMADLEVIIARRPDDVWRVSRMTIGPFGVD